MARFTHDPDNFLAAAPLTIPLFGDQQRALGCFQVFLCTNLRYEIHIRRRSDDQLVIKELQRADASPDAQPVAKSILQALEQKGEALRGGFDCSIVDTGLQHSGLDYSVSEAVCWTAALLAMAESPALELPLEISRIAFNTFGGISEREGIWAATELGGLVALKGFEDQPVLAYETPLDGFIVTMTSVKPDKPIEVSAKEATQAVNELVDGLDDGSFPSAPTDTLIGRLSGMSETNAMIGYAHTIIRDLCAEAMGLFSSNDIEPFEFARLLDEQENMRSDYLGLTTEKMIRMSERAKKAGALACCGFGNDGAMVIYAPRGQKSVFQTIESEGRIAIALNSGKGVCIEDVNWDDN